MRALCREMIMRLFPKTDRKSVLYGENKLYMKMEISMQLDKMLFEWWKYKNGKATKIQQQFRRYMYRKNLKKNLERIHNTVAKVSRIQAIYKMKKQRKDYLQFKVRLERVKVFGKKLAANKIGSWFKS